MSRRTQEHERHTHSAEVHQAYERVVAAAEVDSRYVEVSGRQVHLLEKGTGPPLVLLHGTAGTAGFMLPLLNELHGVRVLAPDRPGNGLSDPIDLARRRYRETTVAWLDRLLDTLELETTALAGHSGGAMWALWYALAHPERVTRLVLIGPPAVPKTRLALPIRLAATFGVGELLPRLVPPSPKSTLRFAHHAAREKETLAEYPDQIALMVAEGRDPTTAAVGRAELRAVTSPFGLLWPSGIPGRSRVRPDELHRVVVPTLMVWGERDPLGDASVARTVTELIPGARLVVLPTGHGPWLGQPARTAETIGEFLR
ncbi:pimeloyl-ACP methyl ester carboxylesterase [Haloactinopolyspora alba]|uniref:Pimeloyl-ACP methyl ester carboxylesterase n=1 Tax=Haloactinopolyspora alba TaxID=648780 RepID=A0A2P8EFQ8_9ACTN|nr:alpha/beta hydrolase [Haloactinopolyspora alba]PSL08308.1 pimeloyl-ACP methyl ester carboxylesterase [Haloactinopolyspora alba]